MTTSYPDLHWECINANPPFSKKWKLGEGEVDSTEWTWKFALARGNYGFFIANHNTLVKQGIDKHPWVHNYETIPASKLWKGMRDTLVIGIAHWKRPDFKPATGDWEISAAWEKVGRIVDDERFSRPAFNIYLDKAGFLRTYLSVRSELKLKLGHEEITRLHSINNAHPLTLTAEKETRDLMRRLITGAIYKIQPEAQAAIEKALAEVHALACPAEASGSSTASCTRPASRKPCSTWWPPRMTLPPSASKGGGVPREFKPLDGNEILATAIDRFDITGALPEPDCEAQWPKLRDAIRKALTA